MKSTTPPTRRTLSGRRVPEVFTTRSNGIFAMFGLGPETTTSDRVHYNGVPANVKARRRAAGKAAKASRKINRPGGAR